MCVPEWVVAQHAGSQCYPILLETCTHSEEEGECYFWVELHGSKARTTKCFELLSQFTCALTKLMEGAFVAGVD